MKRLKKRAFTLAEVLITLVIIGVVAAITIPMLVQNSRNKELETGLKKAYSIWSQATQRVIMEDFGGVLPTISNDSLDKIEAAYQKYIKGAAPCKPSANDCSLEVYPISLNTQSLADFMVSHYYTYSGELYSSGNNLNDGMYVTSDGMFVVFDYGLYETVIMIDVNGWKKKPNRFGYDTFAFILDGKSRKLIPFGSDSLPVAGNAGGLKQCSKTVIGVLNGFGCTAKALTDPNYFKNLGK